MMTMTMIMTKVVSETKIIILAIMIIIIAIMIIIIAIMIAIMIVIMTTCLDLEIRSYTLKYCIKCIAIVTLLLDHHHHHLP
jgi:hypothetical protein